jgi:hypothetical protein
MNRRKWLRRLVVAVSLGALGGGFVYRNRREPRAPTEIFKGITYGCERLEATEEGSGLLHWARIDLTAPGIELYVTPLDPSAVAQGWQYRLRHIKDIVDREHLAIAVNATLFTSNSGWRPRMSGDLANGVETVVADHVVSHVWEHTYLLWFDDQLMPHLRPSKPPLAPELAIAKWGIADKGWACRMARSGPVAAAARMPEPRWPSTGSANFYFWPWANTSRRVWCFRNLPISGPRTGCCLMAGTRARWYLAKTPQEFQRGFCTAGGGRWRRILASG